MDYVLTQDKSFKKWAKAYADDEALWFKECVLGFFIFISPCISNIFTLSSFSAAFSKMLEFGVPPSQTSELFSADFLWWCRWVAKYHAFAVR